MTEFHQNKEQPNVKPPANSVQETLGSNAANDPRKAIPPAQESSPKLNAEATSSQIEEVPYERLQQGPITYFRYYFEDAEQPTYLPSSAAELPTNRRNMLPLYLAGGGILSATLISGFVIAGLANNSKAPARKGTIDSKTKQTPTPKLIQPQVASPEVMPPSRSTPTKPTQPPKKAPTEKLPLPTVRSSLDLEQALMVPKPLPVPDLPLVSVPIARAVSNPLPAPVIQPPTPPTIASAPEAPTPLPFLKPALPELARADSSPKPPDSSPLPSLVQESAPLPPTAIADARCLSAAATPREPLSAQVQQPIAIQSAGLVSAPESVEVLSANRKSQAEKPAVNLGTAGGAAIVTDSATQATSNQDAEKELQAFLELPQRFPSSAGIAVMPLPCQLAQTAITKQRVAEFNVVRLGPQDYQNRWKLSSNNPQALIPIYGFVDYKQQSVVLLSAKEEAKEEKVSQL